MHAAIPRIGRYIIPFFQNKDLHEGRGYLRLISTFWGNLP